MTRKMNNNISDVFLGFWQQQAFVDFQLSLQTKSQSADAAEQWLQVEV